jgi:hypothetical protein
MIDSAILARLNYPSACRAFMASAVLCLTALFVSGSMKAVRAQSGCPPVDQAVAGWAQGTTVYYDINTLPPYDTNPTYRRFPKMDHRKF